MNDILAALDNVLSDGQAHQMTQDMCRQPPGAAITDSPSLTRLQQASFLQSVLPSTSHLTPSTGINPLSQNRPSSHSRAFSQPCLMPSTQRILDGGCGHAGTDLYAGIPQLTLKAPSEPAQSTPLPSSLNASLLSPPYHPQQSPEPAPWNFTALSSGDDANHLKSTQSPMILTPHVLENQSIPASFPGNPGFSPATLSTRFPSADFTDMEPSLSSHTQDNSLAFLNLSSSSGVKVNLVSATQSTGPGYPGALSQSTGHSPTQQATPPATPDSQITEQLPTSKRRRHSLPPKDPRAAKRLRTQRQGDDENLEALYKLLVPRSAGVVQKKDRLSLILRYAIKWMQTQGSSKQQSTAVEQTRDYRSTSPSQPGEPMECSWVDGTLD